MKKTARGTFIVKMVPLADGPSGEAPVDRFSLEKEFAGDIVGFSKGQMLAVRTAIKDSAGYVAMERVDGTVNELKGTFALQHSGTMDRGKPHLRIHVVPDSGTEELAGVTGELTINIVDGKHFYEFEYELAGR